MIINGNTFAYGAFQLDTRPLYIEFKWDATQKKYVPVQDYTVQQITEAAKTRPVFLVCGLIAPLVDLGSTYARFQAYITEDPINPTNAYTFVNAIRNDSGWNIEFKEA